MDLFEKIENIKKEFEKNIDECLDAKRLEEIRTLYLGRKSEFTQILKSLASLPEETRRELGKKANDCKNYAASKIEELAKQLESRSEDKQRASLDVTLPGIIKKEGSLHPLTQTISRISDIFISLGFAIADGPEIETEFYNFEALNIPLDHPSRDAFDTFYIQGKYLLRSHTSNVQIRIMRETEPPIQVIMPGRVYRPDAVDASHSFMFHQVEGLMVDKKISFSDLKGILSIFCRSMFGEKTKTRLRPHFFPFTEPSVEIDISCIMCSGKGCRVCSGSGWLEIMGAGMVNPKVFKAVGYDNEKYKGFAFGMGVERIAMLSHGIDDIRLFYENDVRFLRQFV
ncbi:phenylalanyl-tRNA synthetase subunit alpha [Candidatus Omnitrophus magneticus]|uniref:Phenylalanine--tRNA ligase alpha subunit n=1 Tax=Candidatus Omnitrophus magneticus TaxID=1609969 RepID=A0A0F0CS24_9BACT|nr:phenylalanyl-tRNA synthetase subunit alpha [Candidatus Omnitrophus magneticus]